MIIVYIVDKDDLSSHLFYNYGSVLIKLQRYEEGIIELKKSLLLNPNYSNTWNNLGIAYLELGLHNEEIECYDNALMINPNSQETLFSKGSTLFRFFDNIEEGLNLMLKSTTISNRHEFDFPNLYFWITEAYIAKSYYKKAIEWNKKGLSLFSTDEFLLKQKTRIEK